MSHCNPLLLTTISLVAAAVIIAGALTTTTYFSTSSSSITQSVSTQSKNDSSISIVSSSTHGWINSSLGLALHYPPVTFGADSNMDIAPLGPSVEVGNASNPISIQPDTFVAESFNIVENTLFNEVNFNFEVSENGASNATMAIYVNGVLISQSSKNLDIFNSIPAGVKVAPSIGEDVSIYLSQSLSLTANSVVTVGFFANGVLSITPLAGIAGNSTYVSNVSTIPSSWNGPPSGLSYGPIFLVAGGLNPGA